MMRHSILFLSVVLFVGSLVAAGDFGDRSKTVTFALESKLKKKASEITTADLATVTELKLPHIHIPVFNDDDFAGLTKLKKLQFYSLFHKTGAQSDSVAISGKVFAKLSSLEELIISADQLGNLPDDVFAGLTSLKVLELSYVHLPRLPKSMLNLPKIEAVYYDGNGMNKDD
jgi:Leucine-rich repeat (LRR) protein